MANEALVALEDRVLRARLSDEIDHHTAKVWRERIDGEIFRTCPDSVILDFSSVKFMDSSGIGLILGRCELCRTLGIGVVVVGLSGIQRRLARLAGIDKVKNLTLV